MSAVIIVASAVTVVRSAVISAEPPKVAASHSRPISKRLRSRGLLHEAPHASAISDAASVQEILAISMVS